MKQKPITVTLLLVPPFRIFCHKLCRELHAPALAAGSADSSKRRFAMHAQLIEKKISNTKGRVNTLVTHWPRIFS
jgi:hypothetical protein